MIKSTPIAQKYHNLNSALDSMKLGVQMIRHETLSVEDRIKIYQQLDQNVKMIESNWNLLKKQLPVKGFK